jgi:acetyl-CoA acyltransferase
MPLYLLKSERVCTMHQAVIVDVIRTPVGKAPRGAFHSTRPDELAAAVMRELLERHVSIAPEDIDDVILGCAMPEAESGMNMARIALLRAGLPNSVPGMTVNRFCASGLQAIALAAERIRCGDARTIIAGGAESMSLLPRTGHCFSPNPHLVQHYPEIYMGMGQTAERLNQRLQISRHDQDAFAFRSHERAIAAQAEGRFHEEFVPIRIDDTKFDGHKPVHSHNIIIRDEGPRPDTSMAALSALKPVFHADGSVTAGNSSQTSDGAAAAIVMSQKRARELGISPLARFVNFAVAGVPPELMGIGPAVAVPKVLALAGLTLKDIGLIELNEAFAVQAIAVIRKLGLNEELVNVNGGAIALGHPLGCTGAKLTATILREMRRRSIQFGLVTMCVGGGQGAAAILELL